MNLVKYYRIEMGITQNELVFEAGVRRFRLQLIESGCTEPTISEMERLATALGVAQEKLFPKNIFEKGGADENSKV